MRGLTNTLLLTFLLATPAFAQVEERIASGQSEIVVTVWEGGASSAALVLVPGWGGGPEDVLGVASFLSSKGVSVGVVTPRGWHRSGGQSTFANALDDIGAAVDWARARFGREVALGGYSWGGGMSLAYAARDRSVHRVFSVAGTDHGQFIRQYQEDPQFATMVRELLGSSAAPAGPIRFDVEHGLEEMAEGQAIYGLVENARALSDRSILLIGGWEDVNVTVDETLLPLYRALGREGAEDVTFLTYHADHSFSEVRPTLHQNLLAWLGR